MLAPNQTQNYFFLHVSNGYDELNYVILRQKDSQILGNATINFVKIKHIKQIYSRIEFNILNSIESSSIYKEIIPSLAKFTREQCDAIPLFGFPTEKFMIRQALRELGYITDEIEGDDVFQVWYDKRDKAVVY